MSLPAERLKTVVIIDDEPGLCRLFARILERLDIEVITFTDPASAVAHINTDPPALVICDYRMPSMTGLGVLDRLEVQVPFALISGDLTVEEVQRRGIEHVLSKPLRPEELTAFVERFV